MHNNGLYFSFLHGSVHADDDAHVAIDRAHVAQIFAQSQSRFVRSVTMMKPCAASRLAAMCACMSDDERHSEDGRRSLERLREHREARKQDGHKVYRTQMFSKLDDVKDNVSEALKILKGDFAMRSGTTQEQLAEVVTHKKNRLHSLVLEEKQLKEKLAAEKREAKNREKKEQKEKEGKGTKRAKPGCVDTCAPGTGADTLEGKGKGKGNGTKRAKPDCVDTDTLACAPGTDADTLTCAPGTGADTLTCAPAIGTSESSHQATLGTTR